MNVLPQGQGQGFDVDALPKKLPFLWRGRRLRRLQRLLVRGARGMTRLETTTRDDTQPREHGKDDQRRL